MIFPDTVASSLRRFQAANRHGNGRRENLIAIVIPFGSIGAIELKTAVVRGDLPSSSTSKKKQGMGFSPAGANKPVGWSFIRWSKTALSESSLVELGISLSGR